MLTLITKLLYSLITLKYVLIWMISYYNSITVKIILWKLYYLINEIFYYY